ncbi:hypothetical protein [Shouchella patagoniensis]|uniref:hypothetical protein n=1 Tax=Shouchella patagoniensis TaxID=228576 RepID=UPI000995B7FD|nr:hypothetical protein [Shouchella patagoniensis]
MERQGVDKSLWISGWILLVGGVITGLIIGFTLKLDFGLSESLLNTEAPEINHPFRWAYAAIIIVITGALGAILMGLSELILNQRNKMHLFENSMKDLRRSFAEKD